jgi:hypothetical protein
MQAYKRKAFLTLALNAGKWSDLPFGQLYPQAEASGFDLMG